ncbi:hypothetical protein [uncultured Methylibium sp.]|uniref:hypothetical protein n=1 Tax=uncultured Methylibium sp. TaxID=381093 RepID=UPI0025FB498D|nr:hypothetical protein [uncultured Methylibium sp.]
MSLLDMLKVYAHHYVHLGQLIHEFGGRLYMAEHEEDDPGRPLTSDERRQLKNHLADLSKLCDGLGLKIAKAGFDRATERPPRSSGEYDKLVDVAMDEMAAQLFLFVPSDRAKHFGRQESVPTMPSAGRELSRAGNCLAVGEYTASVFHAMRAVEVGLNAIHLCLGLAQVPDANRNWGRLCNAIRDEIQRRSKGGWADEDFFTSAHATLIAVKDAWRNTTMHVETHYDQPEAELILANVTAFVKKLAARMDEQGQPLA